MLFSVVKFIHIFSVICAVGTFFVQYYILIKSFRSEDMEMRRASENIALDAGRILMLPGLLLALITGLILIYINPVYLKTGFALHVKILFVLFVFGSSHMANKRLKNIKAAATAQDEVGVNTNKKKAANLFLITAILFVAIILLIVLKPF